MFENGVSAFRKRMRKAGEDRTRKSRKGPCHLFSFVRDGAIFGLPKMTPVSRWEISTPKKMGRLRRGIPTRWTNFPAVFLTFWTKRFVWNDLRVSIRVFLFVSALVLTFISQPFNRPLAFCLSACVVCVRCFANSTVVSRRQKGKEKLKEGAYCRPPLQNNLAKKSTIQCSRNSSLDRRLFTSVLQITFLIFFPNGRRHSFFVAKDDMPSANAMEIEAMTPRQRTEGRKKIFLKSSGKALCWVLPPWKLQANKLSVWKILKSSSI